MSQTRDIFPFNIGKISYINNNNYILDTNQVSSYIQFDSVPIVKNYSYYNWNFLYDYSISETHSNIFDVIENQMHYIKYNDNFFSILFNHYNNKKTHLYNKSKKINLKFEFPISCQINDKLNLVSNQIIVNSDSTNIFIFFNFNYEKCKNTFNSAYLNIKLSEDSNELAGNFVSFNKHYLNFFYQPHAKDKNKKWLIARDSNKYDVYLIDKNNLQFVNSHSHFENINAKITDFNSKSGWLSISRDNPYTRLRNFTSNIYVSNNKKLLDSLLLFSFYSFDNLNGSISLIKSKKSKTLYYLIAKNTQPDEDVYYYTLPIDLEFSPNDSIVYVLSSYGIRNSPEYLCSYSKNIPTELIQIKWQNDFEVNYLPIKDQKAEVYNSIELAADGKIYLSKSINYNVFCQIDSLKVSKISKITNPNKFGLECNYNYEAFSNIKINSYPYDVYRLPEHFGRFSNLEIKKSINCKKQATFQIIDTTNWLYFDWFINSDSIRGSSIFKYKFNNIYGVIKVYVKGYHKDGYEQWHSDTILLRKNPSAYFVNQTKIGCQYVGFEFKDSSTIFNVKKDSSITHQWYFGDGNSFLWKTKNIAEKKDQFHSYTQNGFFTVLHVVNDGYCSDSFTRINEVNILKAPKPGFNFNPTNGCSPLQVNLSFKYSDDVDSTHWQSSYPHFKSTLNQSGASFLFKNAGKYKLYQTQFGITGCIIRDTNEIEIIQGIDTSLIPKIITSSVVDNNLIQINWNKTKNASNYSLFNDNTLVKSNIIDTIYFHKADANIKSYKYKIKAFDVCNNQTKNSNISNTILLKADKDKNNVGILKWNKYELWQNGVSHYEIKTIENHTIQIVNLTNDTSFKDLDFLKDGKIEKCYQIQANENLGSHAISKSNIVCVPYESVIWVPTAITINGDGLNESLKLNTFGIKSYTFTIYTRWGEKVFESSNINDEWKPNPEQQGVYMYVLYAVSNYGNYITNGTITVLR